MKKILIISVIIIAIIVLIVIVRNTLKPDLSNLFVEPKSGNFEIIVTSSGELQAQNSAEIRGPEIAQNRNMRSMDIKIQDIVLEGTEVKEGDYVATLDKTTFDNTLKDETDRLTTYQNNLETKRRDTTISLTTLRDNIKNLTYVVEEAKIALTQSKFEPPATIRQAEINLDKAERALEQAIQGYALKTEQAKSDMNNVKRLLVEQQQKVIDFQNVLTKFTITAPSPGLVIYKKDRAGIKRKAGSSINSFDNVVAVLPDLSSMISKTYVNEIDISKVKIGQKVTVIVNAFPGIKYSGSVISVANIGESLPNTEAKVFEVVIKVDGSDPLLRPSMTTNNEIITQTIDSVIYLPIECVQLGTDSIPFVYTKNGVKQIVVLSESNENNVIIEKGIKLGTQIFLNTPVNIEEFKLTGEELISIIKEKEQLKKEAESNANQQTENTSSQRPQMRRDISPQN
jgi:hypothetical protein